MRFKATYSDDAHVPSSSERLRTQHDAAGGFQAHASCQTGMPLSPAGPSMTRYRFLDLSNGAGHSSRRASVRAASLLAEHSQVMHNGPTA